MKRKTLIAMSFVVGTCIYGSSSMIGSRVLGDGNWGTHMAPLVTAVMNTNGPVIEFGCGDFSTPLLHAICAQSKRLLVSAESDATWLKNFLDLATEWHIFVPITQLKDWDSLGNDQEMWDVVFIDHAPAERRVVDIDRMRDKALVFVVHDTEAARYYGYTNVFKTFKYQYTYTRYKKQTTLLSDIIDVAQWFL